MHPDLLNNATFLRYYRRWQENPESIVFAPIAEMFLMYNMVDDAIKICVDGVGRFPDFISGRIALAKAYVAKSEWRKAREQIRQVLERVPNHPAASELNATIQGNLTEGAMSLSPQRDRPSAPPVPKSFDVFDDEEEITEEIDIAAYIDERHKFEHHRRSASGQMDPKESWNTITMARIFVSQGHYDKAASIYDSILARDPGNHSAAMEYSRLRQKMSNE